MATISRAERTASHSIRMMAPTATTAIGSARSASVPNSSSSSGIGPVSRTLTPLRGVERQRRARRRGSRRWPLRRAPAGLKSSLRIDQDDLAQLARIGWPEISARQEKNAGLAGFEPLERVGQRGHRLATAMRAGSGRRRRPAGRWRARPSRPRSDGSAAIGPRNGSAAISRLMLDFTSAVDSKSRPSLAQNVAAVGPSHRGEVRRVGRQLRAQRCGRLLGELGRAGVDHHHDRRVEPGELPLQLRLAPAGRAASARSGRPRWW